MSRFTGTPQFDLWFAEGRCIEPLLARAAEPQPVEDVEVEERPAVPVVGGKPPCPSSSVLVGWQVGHEYR